MKTSIRIFFMLTAMALSVNSTSGQLHQQINQPEKAIFTDNASSYLTSNEAVKTISKNNDLIAGNVTPEKPAAESFVKVIERLKVQASSLKEYAKKNNFNADYCFLIDMSLPSGKNRFFIYDIKADTLVSESLVAHGFGSSTAYSDEVMTFSNNANSYKTSLGRYKIGNAYYGKYGLAFKLYGLDSTNNRAYERAIVLHADAHVPEAETYPYRIFQSAGCPTVSPAFLPVLNSYIRSSKKPILMWIYY